MEVVDYEYESSKISFRRRFAKSFYKFNEYNDLVNTSVKSSVIYCFLMTLLIALLYAVLNVPAAVSLVKTIVMPFRSLKLKTEGLLQPGLWSIYTMILLKLP